MLHISFRLTLTPLPDERVLEAALTALVHRHETLRTAIGVMDGEPVQLVRPLPALPFAVCDLVETSDANPVPALYAEFTHRPFSLEKGPLWRALLVRTSPDRAQLMVTLHHLIADGMSVVVFLRDLEELYQAGVQNRPVTLEPLSIQYGGYAERQLVESDRFHAQLEYWRTRLGGALPVLDLPSDYARPDVASFRGESISVDVPADLAQRLRDVSRRAGATLFMALLAAFKIQLSRLTGVTDVIVGTPVAGRVSADVQPLIGVFINTVALRTQLDGNPSFDEVLERVRETAIGAFANQEVAFDSVVADLKLGYSRTHTPVFNILFNLLGSGSTSNAYIGTNALSDDAESSAKFDVTMYVVPRGTALTLRLAYNSDLFSAARMRELLEQYIYLLEQGVATPARRLASFDCVTATARGVMPDPRTPMGRGRDLPSIAARLRDQVLAMPGRPAALDQRETWTYADMNRRSGAVCARVMGAGFGAGDVVAIYASRVAALAGVLLGIVRSGAAFCLLDPAWPPGRLAACAAAARPVASIELGAAGPLPDELTLALTPTCRHRWVAEDMWDGPAPDSSISAAGSEDPDRLAYLAFTSGTTGGVKVIAGTERPLLHFFDWSSRTFNFDERDRFSMLSGLGHDPLLRDVLMPLWVGARLDVPAQALVRDPRSLAAWIAASAITVVHLTPQHAITLATGARELGLRLDSLRYLFFGGDVLPSTVLDQMHQIAPGAVCVNFYGATETPQAMSWWAASPLAADISTDTELVTAPGIGRGIDDVQILVVTDEGRLAGVGEPGEIWIRTAFLSQGYVNDRALTETRFIANPFTGDLSDRIYITGDLGRFRPDGQVDFLGRRDGQVKVRGFRVELREVEHTLLQHPDVRDAAVVPRRGVDDAIALVAVVVLATDAARTAGELRTFLAERLPAHAVPARFEGLERLPVTASGKVDRRALESSAGPELKAAASAAPATSTERMVAAIFGEVLSLSEVGADDSFFDLGGHSLLAAQVLSRLRARAGVDVPLRLLFDSPTVAALAAGIDRARVPTSGNRDELEL